jgi:hypothetical protein
MAERRPDLAREHRLHDRFRGPPRASPVRFQVSQQADRTSRGWARGVPLAECRFPGPASPTARAVKARCERSSLHSKRPREDLVWWWWWWWWWWCAHQLRITSGRLPRIWGSIHYLESILHGYGLRGSSLATDSPSTCFLSRQVYVPYPTTCSSSACFQNGAPRDCESDVSRPRGVGSGFTHWGHRARRRRACCCTAGWRPGCGAVRRPRAT